MLTVYDRRPMEVQAHLARRLASGADPTDAQFRLLVESVTDYAIFLLDIAGQGHELERGRRAHQGLRRGRDPRPALLGFLSDRRAGRGRPQRLLDAAAREGRVTAQGWRLRKDGSRFWADVVITALRDADGELTGFAKVTRDMTRARARRGARARQ